MFKPTLVRRVVTAIFIAFSVIWLVLTTYKYITERNTDDVRAGMSSFIQYEMQGFDTASTAPEAIQYAFSLEREFNRSRRSDGRHDVLMELSDQHGKRLFWVTDHPLKGILNQVVPTQLDGKDYLIFRGETALWTFQIAYPILTVGDAVRKFGSVIGTLMLIAFPFILLPIWYAVWRGLHPLRTLSALIAARHTDDLSPVDFDPYYGELKPVVSAINRLLNQLSKKIAREHAFVQDAAHELRTPLAVISAHVHVLAKADTFQEKLEAEQRVDNAIARASHLVQQLLELARVDGKPLENLAPLDASHLTRLTLAQAAPAAKARQIELSLDAPDKLPHPMEMHAFQSILHNLVDNAIRYIHPGGKIIVKLKRQANTLTLTVADDGPGIAEEDRSAVFERFYRGKAHDLPGSGLGLAIVQQAAARMGGEVLLSTGLVGRGCQFTVVIPTVTARI
ncbi:sensor histidine kinase [Solimicrobium silvestre]|uniref:histidine kinase n=1 Tax=Solimicrobium silvestre TaxID=2099400 RepID=A0A2S9GWR0_9BURK|nr:HAMP domain-containing sensor histidine kinase [Solimicrobium silvestre]PRC92138.1 Signal transduction histidine kinase [Solimicrobium silvestre]